MPSTFSPPSSLSFVDVRAHIDTLAKQISDSGFRPDYLVGLARGGWIPTRLLSDALGVKEILSLGLRYADATRTALVAYSLPDPMPHGKKLLLIEDCLESGKSLVEAKRVLESAGNEVKTVCLFTTPGTQTQPDFFLSQLPEPPRFPWE